MFTQLVDPREAPSPPRFAPAIGIDLGTTYSVVAICEQGQARVLTTPGESRLIPSVVAFENGQIFVGEEARSRKGAISSIKRLMGREYEPLPLLNKTPIEISAEILRHLKSIAETTLGKPVSEAVITVPAYFDEAARQATKEAAHLAGLTVLRLLNEPTAAALAYGLDRQTEGTIEGTYAVYDLGGGTFDLSIIRFTKGVFQVLATAGDTQLGGDDMDQLIAEKLGVSSPKAREIKEHLSTHPHHPDVNFSITDLADLIHPLLARTFTSCSLALADAALPITDLTGVVLVGGSTRMPAVREAVERFFGQAPLTNLNPDEVVALGAARQAEALTVGSDTVLLDVTPLSLGIETMGGLVEKIIHRNTPIPVAIAQDFTTYENGQDALIVHVVQGEREFVTECRSLATFTLTGIPPLPASVARIRITFTLDVDGLLTVKAQELTTGINQQVEINPSYGLKPDAILDVLKDNYNHGATDVEQRLLIETKLEAEQFITLLTTALDQDGDLLESSDQQKIEMALDDLRKSLNFEDKDGIKTQLRCVEELTHDFADRRINRSMRRALAGQRVDRV
jgi:molecular chaperone HscA